MSLSPLAGKPAPADLLIDVARLQKEYSSRRPDPTDPLQLVSFGTSGHRGTALNGTFNEAHILAITQAICEYRAGQGIDGPLFIGKDTHALSGPAQRTALEVLAANGVEVCYPEGRRLHADAGRLARHPDLQPRPNDGPRRRHRDHAVAQSAGRRRLQVQPAQRRPGRYRHHRLGPGSGQRPAPRRQPRRQTAALRSGAARPPTTRPYDFVWPYVKDLGNVIDMDAIRSAGLKLGVDPLGGASEPYWGPIREQYGLDIEVVNPTIDPTFRFMTVDHDGQIRMDCSSPYAMAGLVKLKDRFRVAFGNDPDSDRHGIVTPSVGLMNPNHYLAVAIRYLLGNRPGWSASAAVGKTLVSSSMIDRVVQVAGPEAAGGAGRIQVVRAGPVRRLRLLRRRGERRRQLPAARRHGLDHGQGRTDHGPAGRGDHGAHRHAIRASITRK